MKEALRIDLEGHIIEAASPVPDHHPDCTPIMKDEQLVGFIITKRSEGLYKPKWNHNLKDWEEGLDKKEVDKIKKTKPPKSDLETRLDAMQAEIDQLKAELAALKLK